MAPFILLLTQMLSVWGSLSLAQCPILQEGPLSGIVATRIPGMLINNVDFIHIPVVLNFSNWKMAEIDQCDSSNISIIYTSLLKDMITDYQERSQDLTGFQKTSLQSGVLHLSNSQQGLDELAKSMSSQFDLGMSIWNKIDLEHIRKHINYFQKQNGGNIPNPLLSGINGLTNEKYYTMYNMNDLGKMLGEANAKTTQLMAENSGIKEFLCNAHGSFTLNIVKEVLHDVGNGKIPDVITDEELAKWYCPNCASIVQSSKQFWGCVTSCKKLKFDTVRKLGSVTPHPNRACDPMSSCQKDGTYISFTLSLPVFDIASSVFENLATIYSVGLLEDSIFKERLNIPPLVIFYPELNSWLTPNTDCCSTIGYNYICRCDVFDVIIPVCGYNNQIQNNLPSFAMSCPVKLTKWRVPIVKVTKNIGGLYCVSTNQKQFSYGGLSCNISIPNFCFCPRQRTVIGHTVIRDLPNINYSVNAISQDNDLPQFNVPFGPLTLRLKKLLEQKNSHVIQISNQKDTQIVNEMINDSDNNLINNSLDQVETRIQILIAIQVVVLLVVLCMLYCLCAMLKHQGFKWNELFSHPYLRISK